MKNLNTVRASVKIEIDGQDVTQDVALVIDPGDSFELERYIKHGNLQSGNRFKFIEKTASVAAHRGNRVEDGIVRVIYQFEKAPVYVAPTHLGGLHYPPGVRSKGTRSLFSASANTGPISTASVLTTTLNSKKTTFNPNGTNEGITAPGSISEQEFKTVAPLNLDYTQHVIILKLLGEVEGKPIAKTVTTRTTTVCETCGHKTRSSTAKFCSNCGASLQLID